MTSLSTSVVIPHYNNLNRLKHCLAALYAQNDRPEKLEVIVVDNASTVDLSSLQQAYPQVKWLSESSMQSPYPCRNKGIQHAKGELIILLDSNCEPLTNFFSVGIASLNKNCDICGGQLNLLHSKSPVSRFDVLYSALRPTHEGITSLPGGVLFVKREVLAKTGLFLPRVRSLGDIEWTNRAHQLGFKLGITAQPVASYNTKEWRAFCKKMIRLGRGKKEIYVHGGGSLWDLRWCFRILKSLLPPNPRFIVRMSNINRQEKTELNLFWLIYFCWLTKLLRGYGMLFGKVTPPCPPQPMTIKKQ